MKGRCILKQDIKNKPVRWGMKILCVYDSANSYMCNAAFYVGKKSEDIPSNSQTNEEKSALHETVLQLVQPFANQNRRVHVDNYYTSVPLI
jgi:hypothetical protein